MRSFLAALGAGLFGVLMAGPAAAVPVTIDFEAFDHGDTISGAGVFADVTFSSDTDLVVEQFGTPPDLPADFGGSRLARGFVFSHAAPVRADFASLATAISVVLGDFSGDDDMLFLRAFDSSGNMIDEEIFPLTSSEERGQTLSVSGSGIAYVLFGSTGEEPNSIYFDNFTYELAETTEDPVEVPEPGTLMLAAVGLGALGLAGRRRRR